ncbi:uroporphyrinogen-III synthase [Virgibacillus pantothenticus]|uniref:uroporphyrinogen-III synthase n=1 Tax=Virgibacillus pantothenticus TaxID=1473 RepID=UPI00098598F6|nr:uroporphyrinogen-III synthase [Virgibacillus pantothenticus]
MCLPLLGKRILITREQRKAAKFAQKIKGLGGDPVEIPLIYITCKRPPNHDVIQQLMQYQWIFFTSGNGVDCFFQLLKHECIPLEHLAKLNIAVVGGKTETKLMELTGRLADFIPSSFDADTMADEFLTQYPDANQFLLVRGNLSRDVLPDRFEKRKKTYTNLEVYETHENEQMQLRLQTTLAKTVIDYITFTSPSTVEAFAHMTTARKVAPCICIGTTTEQRAKELGFSPILTAKEFTVDGMIECIKQDVTNQRKEETE